MKLIRALLCSLGLFALLLYPQDAFSGDSVLLAYSHIPNVCSENVIDDFETSSQPDLELFIPKDSKRKGPELPLLTDEELDSVSAEGLVVIFMEIDVGEPAIILWDEAMSTVTDYYGYGEIHVEGR